MAARSFDSFQRDYLIDRQRAVSYLNSAFEEAMEENDMGIFYLALRAVAEAHGMSKTARDADVSRQNLYKALAKDGNPSFQTLASVAKSLGFTIQFGEAG